MLVIHPDECIDCGVCEPECPVDAIATTQKSSKKWVDINRKYSEIWPNINKIGDPPVDEKNGKVLVTNSKSILVKNLVKEVKFIL